MMPQAGTPHRGSPAHAGIDRGRGSVAAGGQGFPRTRGDRPYVFLLAPGMMLVPPHTRG